jgi:hypothetical protein
MRARAVLIPAMSVAIAATASGCAVGPDAVRKDRHEREVESHTGPGYLGDRAALVGVVMERLNPETIDCSPRRRHVVRCQLQVDNSASWDANRTYVDVRVSRDGTRLAAAGPGVRRFTARYARGQ